MTRMEDLSKEEQELMAKLAEVRREKDKEREHQKYLIAWDAAIKENEVRDNGYPVIIDEVDYAAGRFFVYTPEFSDEYVRMTKTIESRHYVYGEKRNRFSINDYNEFIEKLQPLQAKKLMAQTTYQDGMKELIIKWLSRPRMTVDLDEEKNRVLLIPRQSEKLLAQRFTGSRYQKKDDKEGTFTFWIVRAELPNIWEALINEEGIKWTDAARDAALREVEKLQRLDEIALADDVELDIRFTADDFILRPFQRKGIRWIEETDFNCLLADQMGLGKTAQAIGAFMRLQLQKPDARVLVICPANLIANWKAEIKKLTGHDAFRLQGLTPDKHVHWKRLLFDKPDTWVIINYDILGAKFEDKEEQAFEDGTMAVKTDIRYLWTELINLCKFDMIVADEVHYAKNVEAHRTRAFLQLHPPRWIGLTGTPVLNRPGELWPFLYQIAPEKFPTHDGFLFQYTWDYGKQARNVGELRAALKTLMLRRTKKEVMKDLPPINRIYVHHELSDDARFRYRKVLQGIYEELATWNPGMAGQEMKVTSLLAQMMRLKQICADDKIETVADMAVELSDSDNGGGGKVLIFSQFSAVAKAIHRRLGHESLVYHGEIPMDKRTDIIKQFREDDGMHFLVGTIQTMGTGLNLEVANNAISVDYMWTPAHHQQAEERAYGRLADPHPINSYFVTADDTIENYIQEVLAKKLAVIENVVEGLDTERSQSIANQVLLKLKEEMWKARKKK